MWQAKHGPVPLDPQDDVKYQYLWNCREYLDPLAKIIIATDADEPGQALAEELSRRLGRERCWRVVWPTTPAEVPGSEFIMEEQAQAEAEAERKEPAGVFRKDANEVLINDGPTALQALIQQVGVQALSRDFLRHFSIYLRPTEPSSNPHARRVWIRPACTLCFKRLSRAGGFSDTVCTAELMERCSNGVEGQAAEEALCSQESAWSVSEAVCRASGSSFQRLDKQRIQAADALNYAHLTLTLPVPSHRTGATVPDPRAVQILGLPRRDRGLLRAGAHG